MHKSQKNHICFLVTQCPWTFENSSALFEPGKKVESKIMRKTEELIWPK